MTASSRGEDDAGTQGTSGPWDLDRLFVDLAGAGSLLLAVSGGPDSMALMHLVARWTPPASRPRVGVACVDHGLRPGSAAEAAQVVAAASSLGLAGRVLRWVGEKPQRGIQEQARAARYALLADYAAAIGASHLVTAHTLDDQAETVLFRLARGSGLTGLGGMRPVTNQSGLHHVRPLLHLPKAALVALCERQGWTFAVDPSNVDPAFARSRWRRLAPALAAEGLTAERLGRLAQRLARADVALEAAAAKAAALAAIPGPAPDAVCFDMTRLAAEPMEVLLRVLGAALARRTAGGYLRLQRLETLGETLLRHHTLGRPVRRTLHHCTVRLDASMRLVIVAEGPRRRGESGRVAVGATRD